MWTTLKKQKHKHAKEYNPHTKMICLGLAIFGVVIATGMFWQYQNYLELTAEYEQLDKQIAQEQSKQHDFQSQKEYYHSDAYIEKIAREKLGLVKSNEIVYINRGE